jgi:hypothetical protein
MVYTPLLPGWQTHYYTVRIEQITVGGSRVNVAAVSAMLRQHAELGHVRICTTLHSLMINQATCLINQAVVPLLAHHHHAERYVPAACTSPILQNVYAQGYGAVLDSGTTFTYLPTAAFNSFSDLVDKAAKAKGLEKRPGADPQVQTCMHGDVALADERAALADGSAGTSSGHPSAHCGAVCLDPGLSALTALTDTTSLLHLASLAVQRCLLEGRSRRRQVPAHRLPRG